MHSVTVRYFSTRKNENERTMSQMMPSATAKYRYALSNTTWSIQYPFQYTIPAQVIGCPSTVRPYWSRPNEP